MLHDVFSEFIFISGFRLPKNYTGACSVSGMTTEWEKLKSSLALVFCTGPQLEMLLQLPDIQSKPLRTDFQQKSRICWQPQ